MTVYQAPSRRQRKWRKLRREPVRFFDDAKNPLVRRVGLWALVASVVYSMLFWLGGNAITALLTDIQTVRESVALIMPLVIALPLVSVWCYLFDGVYIGATAAASMMVTMGIAFVIYLFLLEPMTNAWGLHGLWGAVLVFMAVRGLAQAIWYPRLERRLM